jgi:hypothetical protein
MADMVVDATAKAATAPIHTNRRGSGAADALGAAGLHPREKRPRRHHFFEVEDLPWVPRVLRNLITDVLREGIVLRTDAYGAVAPVLASVIHEQRATCVIDLCSGAGGPWTKLKAQLDEQDAAVELVMTDKYPNVAALECARDRIGDGRTRYETESVDAVRVPARLRGVRTLFTGFHHFRPRQARDVLRDARDQRASICVFEFTERRWLTVLLTIPLAPLLTLAYVPRLRPLSLPRLVLTYLVPLGPLSVMWDGVVSNLRTYRATELEAMAAELTTEDYGWTVGTIPPAAGKAPVTYLIGSPRSSLGPHGPAVAA